MSHADGISRKSGLLLAFLLTAVFLIAGMHPAYAAGGISLTTDYPGMSVKPGDSLSISVDIENDTGTGTDLNLELASLPEGWDGYLQGGSYQINRIYVGTEGASFTLHLTVPKECEEGEYQAVVKAVSDSGSESTLAVSFRISEEKAGAGSFTSEYPQQEGASGTSFSFSTTLINNGLKTKSYSLSSQVPTGWTLTFVPSGETTKIAGIDVESGESKGITVSVTPPDQVAAGEYAISCSAVSADETLSVDLKVVITGTYGLSLTTPDGRLSFDAYSGKASDVTLNLVNTGNVELENVSLNSSAPSGWTVTYEGLEDNTIENIPAGATKEVIAHVKPANDTITGDYVTAFTASTSAASSSVDFRVSVKTSTLWGIAAIAVIVAVIAGLGYVFRKYGRR